MEKEQSTGELYRFISNLKQRHFQLYFDKNKPVPHGQSLAYADALLRHQYMRKTLEALPPQIAVIGPTQAGKSTIVNLLLGTESAEASPLAGFTRHAQGFTSLKITDALSAATQSLLPDWKPVSPEQLNNDELDTFSLTHAETNNFPNNELIIWDTPDFDSVNSRNYRATVPVMCAMADAIVLVVSKEKYADQSVWELLKLIAPVQRPLFIIINKTAAENRQVLTQAMREKLEAGSIQFQDIVTLPYFHDLQPYSSLLKPEEIQTLLNQLRKTIEQPVQITPPEILKNWLKIYWNDWLTPIRHELDAEKTWRKLLDAQQSEALTQYERDYLQQPHYSETIQKAIIRLLELLEIPVVAGGLKTIRQIITWPARKIGGLIKDQTKIKRIGKETNQESIILNETCQHYLVNLQNKIIRQRNATTETNHWWQNIEQELRKNNSVIATKIEQSFKDHQQAFEPEIEQAANNLYEYLQAHPVTLNSLRTARISADAAAVVLAIKTGGLSPHDLALAPAFVAITSFLTESAVGQRMKKIEAELKNKQRNSVQTYLFENNLRQLLLDLPNNMQKDELYNITKIDLNNAEQALEILND